MRPEMEPGLKTTWFRNGTRNRTRNESSRVQKWSKNGTRNKCNGAQKWCRKWSQE